MPINSNLAFKSKFPICSICNEPVEAETTKINEMGERIHEECYELEVELKKTIRALAKPSEEKAKGTDKTLPLAIVEFLDSTCSLSTTNRCPICGSELELQDSTFFYEGRSWEIPLSICLKCYPITQAPTHDA